MGISQEFADNRVKFGSDLGDDEISPSVLESQALVFLLVGHVSKLC